jgi:signal transduction histidine kinase
LGRNGQPSSRDQLRLIAGLSRRLSGQSTITGACNDALRAGMALTATTCGEVLFRDARTHQLVCLAARGEFPWCAAQSGGHRLGSKLVEAPLNDQEPVCVADVATDQRLDFPLPPGAPLRRAVSVPLTVRGRTLGAINFCGTDESAAGPGSLGALTVIAGLLAPVIENLYLGERATSQEAERRRFLVRELEASEDERRRIARELHDGLGQDLTGLAMSIDTALAMLAKPGEEDNARATLERSRETAANVLRDIRRVILALRPPALDDMGLFAALEAYAKRTIGDAGIQLHVSTSGRPDGLPPLVENVLFRATQEAINNVARHSGATSCWLTLSAGKARLRINVRDDGVGFDAAAVPQQGHFGLGSMRERVALIDGRILVTSAPGSGTRIDIRVPVKGNAS